MDNENAKGDIERIENRMRTNFFEIEKRLSELEGTSTHSAVEEIKERIQELEDLQMLTQAQIMQMKQQLLGESGELLTGGIEKRLDRIESIINKGVPVAVDHDIERRIESLEKVKDYDHIKKTLDDFEKKMDSIGTKSGDSSYLAKRIEEIERTAKQIPRDEILAERVEKLEKASREKPAVENVSPRIESLEKSITSVREQIDSKISPIEARINIISTGMRELQEQEPMQRRIDLIEKVLKDAQITYNRRFSEMENLVESSGKIITEPGMKAFIDRINEIKTDINKKTQDFELAKDRIDKLLKERQDLIQRIDSSEVNLSKSDALLSKIRTESAKLESLYEKISTTGERIDSAIKDRIGSMEDMRSELYDRMGKISDKIEADISKSSAIRDEIASRTDDVKERLAEIEKRSSSASRMLEQQSSELIKKADATVSRIVEKAEQSDREREARTREMENYLSEVKSRMEKTDIDSRFAQLSGELNEKISKMDETVYKKAENTIQSAVNDTMMKVGNMANETQSRLESRISRMEKLIADTERMSKVVTETENRINSKLNNVSREINLRFDNNEKNFESLRGQSESEIKKQWDEIKGMSTILKSVENRVKQSSMTEDRLHELSTRTLNEYLKKFSSSVDDKIAGIPSRKEFNEMGMSIKKAVYRQLSQEIIDEFAKRLSASRMQSMNPVLTKISALERQLAEIKQFIRGVSIRVPTIVE